MEHTSRKHAIRLANGKPRAAPPPSGTCATTPDEPPLDALLGEIDPAAVAKALLEQVIDLAATPQRDNAELDGLRRRLRETERNLTSILNSPSDLRLNIERERELRQLVQLMRTPPKAS